MFVHEKRRAVRINDEVQLAYVPLSKEEIARLSQEIETGSADFASFSGAQEEKLISLSVIGIAFPITEAIDEASHLVVTFTLNDSHNIIAIARVVACDPEETDYTLRAEFEKISSQDKEHLETYITKHLMAAG